MAKLETRRVNPIAHITLVAVVVLIVFEVLVMGGVLELKSQTVAKYAPWAYEPFLRLVGEHPESASRWVTVEEADDSDPIVLPEINVTGLEPSAIPLLVPTNETLIATNAVPEIEPEPIPEIAPTNAPVAEPEEIVPVG